MQSVHTSGKFRPQRCRRCSEGPMTPIVISRLPRDLLRLQYLFPHDILEGWIQRGPLRDLFVYIARVLLEIRWPRLRVRKKLLHMHPHSQHNLGEAFVLSPNFRSWMTLEYRCHPTSDLGWRNVNPVRYKHFAVQIFDDISSARTLRSTDQPHYTNVVHV